VNWVHGALFAAAVGAAADQAGVWAFYAWRGWLLFRKVYRFNREQVRADRARRGG